jgi:hypothetical protein
VQQTVETNKNYERENQSTAATNSSTKQQRQSITANNSKSDEQQHQSTFIIQDDACVILRLGQSLNARGLNATPQ